MFSKLEPNIVKKKIKSGKQSHKGCARDKIEE